MPQSPDESRRYDVVGMTIELAIVIMATFGDGVAINGDARGSVPNRIGQPSRKTHAGRHEWRRYGVGSQGGANC